jgi:serine/threonine protein kinase
MTPERHALVRRIFLEALTVPEHEREAAVARAAAGDADLLEEIRHLLIVYQSDTMAQADPAAAAERTLGGALAAPGARGESSFLRAGAQIGRYTIVSVLGEGGFGVVYLAEQTEPVRRKVALKVLKAGMDTKAIVSRFRQEQQALAVMDHPNIAKVLDGGETPQGRSYFVMEFVPGEPITTYCDRRSMSIEERLRLFLPVCDAVQHAHMKGIIHRDLKPSNVIVHEAEGVAVPKVIDFGVAKALSGRLTDRSLMTEMGFIIGTPEYMAPEQAEAGAIDVDTRADVYSLGVMLYEALTGVLPFDPEELRRAGREGIRRHLRDTEPPRPSARLSSLAKSREEARPQPAPRADQHSSLDLIAAHRRTDPGSLARLLRSELEWVPLKAMRKDRSERYRSPADLAEDIRNYLEGRPLIAGPESVAYRASKFVKRHRLPVGAGAAFVLLLVGSTVVLASLLSRTRTAERGLTAALQTARDAQAETATALTAAQESEKLARDSEKRTASALAEARAEAEKAKTINRFVRDMLSAADPGVDGREVKVASVLDRAASQIDRTLSTQPEIAAAMHETIGITYQGLGLHPEAIAQFRKTLEKRRATLGEDHVDTLIAMRELGGIARTRDQAEGEELLKKAIEGLRRVQGADSKDAMLAVFVLGQLYQEMGRSAEAEKLLEEAARAGKSLPDTDEYAPEWDGWYAIQLIDKGDLAGAEPYAREALRRGEIAYGPESPRIFAVLNVMGRWHMARNELDKAEGYYKRAYETSVKVQGEDHPETVYWMHNYARVLQEEKRYGESRDVYLKMIPIQRKLNEASADTLLMLANYAKLCDDMGKDDEAEKLFREVLEKSATTMEPDHQNRLIWLNNLARLLDTTGRSADAEPVYKELVERSRRALPGQFLTAIFERNYAGCLVQLGKFEDAEPLMLDAEKIIVASVPKEHPHVKTSWARLADLYDKMSQPEKAKPWRDKIAELEKAAPPTPPPAGK